MVKKDSEIYVNKLDSILGNKRKFRRLVALVLVATPLIIGSVAAWRGCSIETKKGTKFNVHEVIK